MFVPSCKVRRYNRWFALLPMALAGLWFYLLEWIAPAPRFILYASLDNLIPFVPAFVVPYVLWYFTCAGIGLWLFFKDEGEFIRYASYIAGGMLIACFVYTFWPNGQMLRPDLSTAQGPFNAAIRFLYSIDTPTNSSPSIHVTYAVGSFIAFNRYAQRHKRRPWLGWLTFLATVSIVFSTVFIKQHSVLCVVSGLLLSAFLASAIYGRDTVRSFKAHRLRRARVRVNAG